MRKNKTMIVAFLSPALLCYLIIFVYPTIRTTMMTFFEMQSITTQMKDWNFIGFDNYKTIFASPVYHQSMINLVKIWFYGGVATFVLALMFAVMLTSGIKGKSFFRAIMYLPNVVSAVAMGTMWVNYIFNSRYGMLYKLGKFLNWDAFAAIQWTGPDMIFTSMLIAYCFGMIGYFMLIFMSAIEGIPMSFYEAATLAGANLYQKFRYITLPLLKDVFRTNIVLWTVATAAFFVWSRVFTNQGMSNGTVTPVVYMYNQLFGATQGVTELNVGAGAAIGVTMALIVLAMFLITSIIFKDDKLEY